MKELTKEQEWIKVEAIADQAWRMLQEHQLIITAISRGIPLIGMEDVIRMVFNAVSGELLLRQYKQETLERNEPC